MGWLFWSLISAVAAALVINSSSLVLRGFDALTSTMLRALSLFVITFPIWASYYINDRIKFSIPTSSQAFWILAVFAAIVGAFSWWSFNHALVLAREARISAATVTTINYSSLAIVALLIPLQNRIELFFGADPTELPRVGWNQWIGIALVIVGLYFVARRN